MPPKPFKPPRPISTSTPSTTSKAKPTRTTTIKPKPKPAASSKGKGKAITLSDSEEADEVDDIDMLDDTTNLLDDSDDLDGLDAEPVPRVEPPVIPQKLLARLLHEHFAEADTRITKEAMEGLTKYIEIFAREAVARACFAKDEGGGHEGGTNDFLEVDDLERLAPQLLLDF